LEWGQFKAAHAASRSGTLPRSGRSSALEVRRRAPIGPARRRRLGRGPRL